MTWPLLVSLTLSLSLNFVDSFFLAHISDRAAAATGALLPLLGATLVVFIAVGQAGASVSSQLIGARRYDEVPITYLSLVAFNLLLGLGTSLLFFLLRHRLPEWLGLAGELRADASVYLGVLGSFQFLKATQIAYGNILNSRGQTQWVLAEALITNVCNVALNLVFLHGALGVPRLGVAGVALSTVLSLAVGLAFTMCVAHLRLRVRFPRQLSLSQLKGRLRQVLRIGLPSAVEPISYQCSQMVVNALVISWGAQALAARTYVINFVTVTTILWGAAFGIGTQVMVAHRVGAQDFDDANAQMQKALRFAVLGNLALSTLVAIFHVPLLSTLTLDPKIHEFAAPLFWLGLLVEPCRAVNIVAGGALRCSGDARYTALVGMLMMWSVGVPACYLFGRWLGYGLPGVWLGLFVDELVRGLINHRRWRAGRWKEFGVGRKPAPAS
ncbi:MAG TPA: MATE family efflux transporter [Polyangiaceae bacterium]|nr:MATE family efflux transporter [Polyangiaceae bacterium]